MTYLITMQADITIEADDILEATTRAHAMLQALDGVGTTRIVEVIRVQGEME